ncbi:MAG: LacI family transcriptional regulator [Planctomycetota bacterium]|nr:LacI family transcriptional regulator [Planctomycetota bacterium]
MAGRASLAEALAEEMAEAIARGKLRQGDLLPPERALAARHGISRVTVRAALSRLAVRGIIERLPAVGYAVAAPGGRLVNAGPVGLIYGDIGGRTLAASRSVGAIEAELARRGRALLVGASGLTGEGEDECIRRFRAAGARALVIAPAIYGTRPTELENWIRKGLPVVLEGHPGRWLLPETLAARCPQVDVDNRGGVRAVMEYLWGLGHRGFAFVSPSPAEGSERCAAFVEFLRERGISPRPESVLAGLPDADLRSAGREGFRRLYEADGTLPTAVVCPNDDVALGVIEAARAAGLRCPEDISVTGFGNESVDGPAALGELTTLEFSRDDLARHVVGILEIQMAGGASPRPARIRIPARLVVRRSCVAAPAAGRTQRRGKS